MKRILNVILLSTCIILACKSVHPKNAAPLVVMKDTLSLNGTWQLKSITGGTIAFETLYPRKIPLLNFDIASQKAGGHTGCNSFSGKFVSKGSDIKFEEPIAMTKMFCPGEGEALFFQNLRNVTSYSISNDTTLNLEVAGSTLMRLRKK